MRHCCSPHRQQQGYDELRDSYLACFEIRVLRLADDSVRNDLRSVICAIRDALARPPLTPSPFPNGKGIAKAALPPIPLTPFPNGKGEQQ
jgi:hypothetical protein